MAPSAPLSLLLVDDNPTDVFVIKQLLAASGLNVRVYVETNGHDALKHLQAIEKDEFAIPTALVILDLNLPKVNGFAVLNEMRSVARWRDTPVIVITSSCAESDRAKALRLGAAAFFHKPADLETYAELPKLIRRVLRSQGETSSSE